MQYLKLERKHLKGISLQTLISYMNIIHKDRTKQTNKYLQPYKVKKNFKEGIHDAILLIS